MYCYHCGKKIYNKMLHCPYCENDIQDMSSMLFHNTLDELSLMCPQLDETASIEFSIKGIPTIIITDKLYACCTIRKFCQKLFKNTCDKVSEYILSNNYGQIDRNGYSYFEELGENIAYVVMAFCKRNNKFEEFNLLEESKYAFMLDVSSLWAAVQGGMDEFTSREASICSKQNEIRKVQRTRRWVGGGIGIRGAIVGSIQADIMNFAGDAITNVTKKTSAAIVSGVGALKAAAERNEFKNSQLFSMIMKNQLLYYFEMIEVFLLKEFGAYVEQYKNAQQQNYFSEYQDFKEMDISIAMKQLKLQIFNANVYVSLYKNNKLRGMELYRLAEFCCIDENVLKWFIQWGDKEFFDNHRIDQIGYDTNIDTLRQVRNEIIELKANNCGYRKWVDGTEKLSALHKKVDELIMEHDAKEQKQLLHNMFTNNQIGDAIKSVMEMCDGRMKWLLFNYMRVTFNNNDDFYRCVDAYYPLIIEAYWLSVMYTKKQPKILKLLEEKVRVWSPFAYSYLAFEEKNGKKGYRYDRNNMTYHVWEGAKNKSLLAWWYLGLMHKDKKIDIEENRQIAKIYLKSANFYGVGDRTVLESLN